MFHDQGRSVVRVFVTIEAPGEPPRLCLWRGASVRGIKRGARKMYGSASDLQFGKPMWLNYYGAH